MVQKLNNILRRYIWQKPFILLLLATLTFHSCSLHSNKNSNNLVEENNKLLRSDLRPLSQKESLEDFQQLVAMIKAYYGPLQYKLKTLNLNFNTMVSQTQARIRIAKDEDEKIGHIMNFVSQFKDGHFKISAPFTSSGLVAYKIPIVLTPVEDKMVIFDHYLNDGESQGVKRGDVVVSIDGLTYHQILEKINAYLRFGNELTNSHLIIHAFNRPAYMTELKPANSTAQVIVKKADGQIVSLSLAWTTIRDSLVLSTPTTISNTADLPPSKNQTKSLHLQTAYESEFKYKLSNNSISLMSEVEPFYFNSNIESQFQTQRISLSAQTLSNLNIKSLDQDVFSVKYEFLGKKILMVRISTYVVEPQQQSKLIKYYSELLKQHEADTDVLILDQTNNPGGNFCHDFFKLFINKRSTNVLYRFNVDRKNLGLLKKNYQEIEATKIDNNLLATALSTWNRVEKSSDLMLDLTPPISPDLLSAKISPASYSWKKPMLVVSNELSMSCGDIFNLLIQKNNVSKIFGQKSAGFGGNVENVGQLFNSNLQVNMTRSLFQFGPEVDPKDPFAKVIENRGIEPDYKRSVTLEDIRNGYTSYFTDLSTKAVEQIAAPPLVK